MSRVTVDLDGLDAFKALVVRAANESAAETGRVYAQSARDRFQRTGGRGPRGQAGNNAPSAPGEPPAIQYGTLKRSVDYQPPSPQTPHVSVGTNLPCGKYLELGASPRPSKGRALAVPLSLEAAKLWLQYRSVKAIPNTFMLKRKGRAPLICQQVLKGGKTSAIKPLFVLLSSTTILKRPWLVPTMKDPETAVRAERRISAVFRRVVIGGMQQLAGSAARIPPGAQGGDTPGMASPPAGGGGGGPPP